MSVQMRPAIPATSTPRDTPPLIDERADTPDELTSLFQNMHIGTIGDCTQRIQRKVAPRTSCCAKDLWNACMDALYGLCCMSAPQKGVLAKIASLVEGEGTLETISRTLVSEHASSEILLCIEEHFDQFEKTAGLRTTAIQLLFHLSRQVEKKYQQRFLQSFLKFVDRQTFTFMFPKLAFLQASISAQKAVLELILCFSDLHHEKYSAIDAYILLHKAALEFAVLQKRDQMVQLLGEGYFTKLEAYLLLQSECTVQERDTIYKAVFYLTVNACLDFNMHQHLDLLEKHEKRIKALLCPLHAVKFEYVLVREGSCVSRELLAIQRLVEKKEQVDLAALEDELETQSDGRFIFDLETNISAKDAITRVLVDDTGFHVLSCAIGKKAAQVIKDRYTKDYISKAAL